MRRLSRLLLLVPLVPALAACGNGTSLGKSLGGDVTQADLTVAAANMASWYSVHGTYVGADPGPGVTVVRADNVSWCVQTATSHEAGPGGSVLPGGC